jgi:NAD(P)H dehydrogenase (quinone)
MLLSSGLEVTILQPTAYIQNIGLREIISTGLHRVPYPVETAISLVDIDDVAAVAALVLTEPGHQGATYELAGTPPLTQVQVAQMLSEWLGRPVQAMAESIEDWKARARAAGMGDYQRQTLAKMFRYYAQHGLGGNPKVLTCLLGRSPATLTQSLPRMFMRSRRT